MLPCVLYDTWYNTIAVQLHCTDAPPVYCYDTWYNTIADIVQYDTWHNTIADIVQMLPCVLYDTWHNTVAVQLHCTDAPLCTV